MERREDWPEGPVEAAVKTQASERRWREAVGGESPLLGGLSGAEVREWLRERGLSKTADLLYEDALRRERERV